MTVSGVRPAGPAPMRISAVAVGETSSGMVVEWSARSRIEHSLGDWLKILIAFSTRRFCVDANGLGFLCVLTV
jgi:hypothetical protein